MWREGRARTRTTPTIEARSAAKDRFAHALQCAHACQLFLQHLNVPYIKLCVLNRSQPSEQVL